jgi:flagellar hook-associated protein 2
VADPLSSFTGVASGVDWKGLVDQMVKLQRRPADRMQAAITGNTARREALTAFQATLRKLQTAGDALRFGGAFAKFTAAAAGTDASGRAVVAGRRGRGRRARQLRGRGHAARPGAEERRRRSASRRRRARSACPARSPSAASASPVAAGDSLAAVRDKINAVQAQVRACGRRSSPAAPTGGDARLVLTAARPGSAGAFAVADDPDTPVALGDAPPDRRRPGPAPGPRRPASASLAALGSPRPRGRRATRASSWTA